MAREILTKKDILRINTEGPDKKLPSSLTVETGSDKYIDRLFKYIPAEIVAGYIFVLGVMSRLQQPAATIVFQWIIFSIFCFLTPLYLWRIQNVKKLQQHVISLLSFVAWVFALGGPFALYGWYDPIYGQILLPVFTLTIAIWEAE